jgi:hypothetical protein
MILKHLLILATVIIFPALSFAQKLPNTQEAGLRAPQNVKIDGKLTEWDNKFQAYNHATDISYTISNDDENVYLVVQATDHTIINKILGGGLVFTVNTAGEKNALKGVNIMYPVLDMNNRVWVNLKAEPEAGLSPLALTKWADSIMNAKNKEFANKSKVIRVNGIKGVDSTISVYNRDGIKAAATFNNKLAFTFELSISLEKLGIDIRKTSKFVYNIKLPGVNMAAVYAAAGQATTVTSAGYVLPIGTLPGYSEEFVEKNQPSFPYKVHQVDFTGQTGFWGEYTLSTK